MRLAGILAMLALASTGALLALATPDPGRTALLEAGRAAAAELAVPDPDLAVVVGLAQAPSLLGIPLGRAPDRVLAVPVGAPDELGALEPTGRSFAFTDPHGNAWTVTEYRAAWGYAYGTLVGPDTLDPEAGAYNFVLLVDHTKVGSGLRVVAA